MRDYLETNNNNGSNYNGTNDDDDFEVLLSSAPKRDLSRSRAYQYRASLETPLDHHPEAAPPSQQARVVFREDTTFWGSDSDSKQEYLSTILWCASSAAYAVLVKIVLDSYPRPFTITSAVLTVQALYSCLKWFVQKKKRHPRFRKLRQRHYTKLLPAALLHGIGTVLSHYAAAVGPISTSVMMKLVTPRSNPIGSLAVMVYCFASAAGSWRLQLVYSGAANAFFASRSRIRISTHRFNGGQNVFEVTCLASLFLIALPGMLLFERGDGGDDLTTSYLLLWLLLPLLGVLYCINNEMAFHYSLLPHSNLWRRWVSYLAAVATVDAVSYIAMGAAMAVFGVVRYFAPQHSSYTSSARDRTQSHDSVTSMSSFTTSSSLRMSQYGGA